MLTLYICHCVGRSLKKYIQIYNLFSSNKEMALYDAAKVYIKVFSMELNF